MERPFGSVTSTGWGNLTFNISSFTGALLSRSTLEGSCLVSPPGPCGCGCCANNPAVSRPSEKWSKKIFFVMIFSLPHSGGVGRGIASAGHSNNNRPMFRHQILLCGLLNLLGGHGSQLSIRRIDEVGIVVKNSVSANLIGHPKG